MSSSSRPYSSQEYLNKNAKEQIRIMKIIFVSFFGLIIFLSIASIFPFKDKINSILYPKPSSYAAPPNLTTPDLDVTYIERTPRYFRYCISNYDSNSQPILCPNTQNQKHWPSVGENVTYTVHIINKGSVLSSGFSYQWQDNGAVVNSGTFSQPVNLGQEITLSFINTFPSSPHTIKFIADPQNTLPEFSKANNNLSIGSHDMTISYWVETGYYNAYNNVLNMMGTYSFEDWIQSHFKEMNLRFSQAVYPDSPQGILMRVRIDKIVISNDLDGSSSLMNSDPDQLTIDGRWQTTDGDPTNQVGQNGLIQSYVNQTATNIDYGLLHETTHQLGAIDEYHMNHLNNEPAHPNCGIYVLDINGNFIDCNKLPVEFPHAGLMGGGSTMPYNIGNYYSNYSSGGLNSDYTDRRGYYGVYLFDTPLNTTDKILDRTGFPITSAQINFYQKNVVSENIDNIPEITGTTDSQGQIVLPNRSVVGFTTLNGHTMRSNPFGQINNGSLNGMMLVKVTKGNSEGYGYLTVQDLNVAYWAGQTNSALISTSTNYPFITSGGQPTPPISPPPPLTITPSQAPSPIGNVDNASCTQILGWSCDPSSYSSNNIVNFYQDGDNTNGTYLGSATANGPNNGGVTAVCGNTPNHGFTFTMPSSQADPSLYNGSSHPIYSYGVTINGSTMANLNTSPSFITCQGPSPTPTPTRTPTPTPTRTPTPVLILGDTNGDGVVNLVDLSVMLSNFNKTVTSANRAADLNNDNAINSIDFSLMVTILKNAGVIH